METVYIVVPLLLIGVVLAAVWLDRWSVPVILVAGGPDCEARRLACGRDLR